MSAQTGNQKVGKAVEQALAAGAIDADLSTLPNLTDMSAASITENVIAINSMCTNPRQRFIFEKLVTHLHDLIRETSITTEEWMQTITFLTKVGQTCTNLRQEFILLSDILGVSALVDSTNHPVPQGSTATEATVLGPFFVEDSQNIENGQSIASEGKGEYMHVSGSVLNLKGEPIPNCLIETWETDDEGLYDTQYDGAAPDCRGRLRSDEQGRYAFRAVKPVSYPIPNDGPVGKLLQSLGRHVFRPSHLHMMLEAKNYETLTTALYPKGDKYLTSDAVFGVKTSLICELTEVKDEQKSKALGFSSGAPFWELKRDFILQTVEEAAVEKKKSLPNYYNPPE